MIQNIVYNPLVLSIIEILLACIVLFHTTKTYLKRDQLITILKKEHEERKKIKNACKMLIIILLYEIIYIALMFAWIYEDGAIKISGWQNFGWCITEGTAQFIFIYAVNFLDEKIIRIFKREKESKNG